MKVVLTALMASIGLAVPALSHETPHEVTYLVLSGFSKQNSDIVDMVLIPMKSREECEKVGPEIIESSQLHVLRKGYECVDGLL